MQNMEKNRGSNLNLISPLNSFSDPPEPTPRHTYPHRHDPSPIQFFHEPQHSCVSPSFYDPNAHVHPPLMSTTVLSAHQSHDQSISREEFIQKHTDVLQRP